MSSLNILATSDVHSPKWFAQFMRKVEETSYEPDLVMLAGDMILRGRVDEYRRILNVLNKFKAPKVAVPGNEEYEEIEDIIRERFKEELILLSDEILTLKIKGFSVGIVGTRGSLEQPTYWQSRNIPDIRRIYSDRVRVVDKLLSKLRADFRILASHYSVTFRTLKGENPRIWKYLGHRGFERVIERRRPDLVIHGHSHRGTKFARIHGVSVYNVAFPLWKELVIIEMGREGLMGFL